MKLECEGGKEESREEGVVGHLQKKGRWELKVSEISEQSSNIIYGGLEAHGKVGGDPVAELQLPHASHVPGSQN